MPARVARGLQWNTFQALICTAWLVPAGNISQKLWKQCFCGGNVPITTDINSASLEKAEYVNGLPKTSLMYVH